MNKLAYMKPLRQNVRESVSYTNNIGMAEFQDKHTKLEKAGLRIPFKHNWSMLCHMHDLRLWTVAYSPSKQNNLQRMQEMHRINNEAIYMTSNALYKRIILGVFLWFVVNKLAKGKYLNNGAKDSHEVSWRDNTSTL